MNARLILGCFSLRIRPGDEDVATALVHYEDAPPSLRVSDSGFKTAWISASLVPQDLLELHTQHVSDYVIQASETKDRNTPTATTRADNTGFDGDSDEDIDDGSSTIYGSDFIAPSGTPSIHQSIGPEELEDEEEDFAAMCCCKRPTQCECECHTDVHNFKINKKPLKRVIIDDDDE